MEPDADAEVDTKVAANGRAPLPTRNAVLAMAGRDKLEVFGNALTEKVTGQLASIVIPAHNEVGNIVSLIDEIIAVMGATDYEIIVVDDGSTDETAEVVLRHGARQVRLSRHLKSGGQSAAVHSGVAAARFELVCTLDGDGQNPPPHIPELLAVFAANQDPRLGLVAGQRIGRKDTTGRRIASYLANTIRRWALNDATRDTGCGLKAFRRDAFLALPYFNHMHRYLPALFSGDGWTISHVDVTHRPRGAGRSHYSNLQRALVGVADLFGVAWLLRRRKRVSEITELTGSGGKH